MQPHLSASSSARNSRVRTARTYQSFRGGTAGPLCNEFFTPIMLTELVEVAYFSTSREGR